MPETDNENDQSLPQHIHTFFNYANRHPIALIFYNLGKVGLFGKTNKDLLRLMNELYQQTLAQTEKAKIKLTEVFKNTNDENKLVDDILTQLGLEIPAELKGQLTSLFIKKTESVNTIQLAAETNYNTGNDDAAVTYSNVNLTEFMKVLDKLANKNTPQVTK